MGQAPAACRREESGLAAIVILLDSTALIDYLRGRPAGDHIDAMLDAGERLATTGINVEEIARGLRANEEESARTLFSGLVVIPIGFEEGWMAGRWRKDAGRQGVTLTQADCLIAAAAVVAQARLVTGNPKDFRFTDADVEHWPVGR